MQRLANVIGQSALLFFGAFVLESADRVFKKATAATAKGKSLLAELWSRTAVQHQEHAEYYRKAAEAYSSGNDAEAEQLEKEAKSAEESAKALKKEAEELEESEEA